MRKDSLRLIIAMIAVGAIPFGCALGPGHGWTRARIESTVTWSAEGRLQTDGLFKTSKNYRLRFEAFELKVQRVEIETVADGIDSDFDPAMPPPGYTLCHNGHCHNDAGELIDYDDILLEMNSATDSIQTMIREVSVPVLLDLSQEDDRRALTMGICSDPRGVCEVGPSDVRSINLIIEQIAVKVTVFHDEYFPDGVDLHEEIDLDVKLSTRRIVTLGEDAPKLISLKINLELRPQIWDALDFQELTSSRGQFDPNLLYSAFEEALKRGTELSIFLP